MTGPVGRAAEQSRLWGAATRDWAEICEPLSRPLHEATLAALAPLAGLRLLDVGCGAGLAMLLAARQDARVTGLDVAVPMLRMARERLPEAVLQAGDLQALPFDDGTFDVVTAFNAVQYAADPGAAMAELARVTRPRGRVAPSGMSSSRRSSHTANPTAPTARRTCSATSSPANRRSRFPAARPAP
jgi:ubiquinone/menaquinone biosynthesis C-methylase UbiE